VTRRQRLVHYVTHPAKAGPRIKLPRSWVPCPLCRLHYVVKGRAHWRLCSMVKDI
jgi:hypothetical protein